VGDDIDQAEMIFTKEFWEIVKQDKEYTQGRPVEQACLVTQFPACQKGIHEFEQINQQSLEEWPKLEIMSIGQSARYSLDLPFDFQPIVIWA
jgi:hypothetical protein